MNSSSTRSVDGKGSTIVTVRPYDFGTDAIERQRVSLGQSLIDADFEYGLQATKWQSYQETRKTPSFYEIPGSDIYVSTVVADSSVPANVTVTMAQLATAQVSGPTSSGTVSFLAITFKTGTLSGTIANNQYVLGLSAYIPTGPITLSLVTATTAQLNFPSQAITSIPDGTSFQTIGTYVPATSTPSAPSIVSITGLSNNDRTADRAEGFFLVTGSTLTSSTANFTYIAKGAISGGTISTAYTVCRRGGVFNNGNAKIQVSGNPVQLQYPDRVLVTTTTTHGLVPGTPITTIGYTGGSGVNGNFFITSVPTPTSFTYTPTGSTGSLLNGTSGVMYVQPYSTIIHRPFDGGVLITPGQPAHGSSVTRQSKKVFRYQSGKGLLWSSGTLFCPNNDLGRITCTQTITTATGFVADASPTTSKIFTVDAPGTLAVGQTVTPVTATLLGILIGPVTISAINGLSVTVTYPLQTLGKLISASSAINFATTAGASQTVTSVGIDVTPTTSKVYGVYSTQSITLPVTSAVGGDGTTPTTTRTLPMTNTTGLVVGQLVTGLAAYIINGPVVISSVSTNTSIGITYQSQVVSTIPINTNITVNALAMSSGQYLTLGAYQLGISGQASITSTTSTTITVSYPSQTVTAASIAATTQLATIPVGSVITVYTSIAHGAPQFGATIVIKNISTPGYNGSYPISNVVSSTVVTVLAQSPLTTATPVLGDQPRFVMANWQGSCVRVGTFEDQNGLFWEYDGQTLWVVKRSSTFQIAGTSTVVQNSQTLVGATDGSVPTATITSANFTSDLGYGATSGTLTNIVLSSGTLLRGMQTTALTGGNSPALGYISVQSVLSQTSAVVTFLPYVVTFQTSLNAATTSSGSVSSVTISYASNPGFVTGMTVTNLSGYISGTVTFAATPGATSAVLNLSVTQVINNLPSGFIIQAFGPVTSGTSISGSFTNPTTRFQDQLRVDDRIVIRGMTHTVTSIPTQGILTFNPPYRGSASITVPTTVCKIKEQRTPQSQFNRDTIDGSGASGFKVDLTKMQMVGIQYTWYGAGFIDFMIRGADGNWVYAHRYRQNNLNDESYMRTGNMPVRYELVTEQSQAVSILSQGMGYTDTTINLNEDTTYWPSFGTVLIDNELISYQNKAPFQLQNCTRGAVFTYNTADIVATFAGSNVTTHSSNTSVVLASCTCTPSLTHWGSAFLIDGQFDGDRGYFFNYQFNQTSSLTAGAAGTPFFFLRLSPSVSNGIIGDIGIRELLNRAQLLLQKLDVIPTGAAGASLNVQGILNPSGFTSTSFNWTPINSTPNGSQPSFAQIALAPSTGTYTAGSGERIFSMIAPTGALNTIDLSNLKELSNTVIGGNGFFPDGPDTLMIIGYAFNAAVSTAFINLYWTEAQA
jgi:hypothetical protein